MKYIVAYEDYSDDIQLSTAFDFVEEANNYAVEQKKKHDDNTYKVHSVEIIDVNCEFTDFDENDETVLVNVTAKIDDEYESAGFNVQMTGGEYRSDLGCWITTDAGDGEFSNKEKLIDGAMNVISVAESFAEAHVEEEDTIEQLEENGEYVTLLIKNDGVQLVTKNSRFINSATSSYQRRFSDVIQTFDDVDDAKEWLAENSI